MTTINLKKEAIIILILLAPIIYLLLMWNQVPSQLPIHWNYNGEVDGYGAKYTTSLIVIGLYLLLLIIPKIDPRKKNYEIFSDSYYKIRLSIIFVLSIINTITVYNGIYQSLDLKQIIPIIVFALLAIIGNYMATIKPNYFTGIRTPWTLDNEDIWKKTHQLASKIWFVGGITGIILSLSIDSSYLHIMLISIVVILALAPTIYSYLLFKEIKANN